jgi:ferredoxin-NADP reductase
VPSRYPSVLLGRDLCGDDVVTCRFARPEGYEFRAGQWFRLFLQTGEGELAETFSHCSAPGDDALEMTTRLSGSTYKNALAALESGAGVFVSAPGGRLAIPERATRVAFLIGGIGITPVHSMLRDASHNGRVFDDALLLYGNRDERCAPFAEEFSAMGDMGVRMVLCFERPSPEWQGERGFITAETVRRHVEPGDGRPFIVAGPPVMVEAMECVLDELGVGAHARIVEHFGKALR